MLIPALYDTLMHTHRHTHRDTHNHTQTHTVSWTRRQCVCIKYFFWICMLQTRSLCYSAFSPLSLSPFPSLLCFSPSRIWCLSLLVKLSEVHRHTVLHTHRHPRTHTDTVYLLTKELSLCLWWRIVQDGDFVYNHLITHQFPKKPTETTGLLYWRTSQWERERDNVCQHRERNLISRPMRSMQGSHWSLTTMPGSSSVTTMLGSSRVTVMLGSCKCIKAFA